MNPLLILCLLLCANQKRECEVCHECSCLVNEKKDHFRSISDSKFLRPMPMEDYLEPSECDCIKNDAEEHFYNPTILNKNE